MGVGKVEGVRAFVFVLPWLLVLPACGGVPSPEAAREIERRDSAGVELVTVPDRLVTDAPGWRLREVPVLTIGGDELQGFPLSRIEGGVILPPDRIAIADGVVDRVAVVSFDRELVRTIGRVGEGPGEYSDMEDLRPRAGDELAVWDGNSARIVVIDTTGAFVEMIRPPPRHTAQRSLPFSGFLSDGSLVFQRRGIGSERPEREVGRHRPGFVVDRYAPSGERAGVLAVVPGSEWIGVTSGRNWRSIPVPFAGRVHLAVGDGSAVVAHGERFALRIYGPEGLARIVTVDRSRRAPSAQQIEEARDSAVARAATMPFASDNPVEADDIEVGDSLPVFEDLHADADGRLWIREMSVRKSCCTWVVLETGGTPLGRVDIPGELRVLSTYGDLLLGYEVDALDVPRIVLHRIERSEGS